MQRFGSVALALAFAGLMVGCNQAPTSPAVLPDVSQGAQGDTSQAAPEDSVSLSALSSNQPTRLKFGTAELDVPEGALPAPATFTVKKLPTPQNDLTFPAGPDHRTQFFLREVKQRKLIGVYRVQTDAANIQGPLTLYLHIGGKPIPGAPRVIEQIFAKDNVSGNVKLASISYGEDRFSVPGVLNDALTGSDGQKDVTYYVYRTGFKEYSDVCSAAGGGTVDDFCSFLDKPISSEVIKPLAAAPNLEILSWNVGNANAIVETGCGLYNVKLCFIANEVLVADYITDRIRNGTKPDIIFFRSCGMVDARA